MIHNYFSRRAAPLAALLTTLACLPLLAATSAHAAPVWMERFGNTGAGQDTPTSTATDTHDNILVTGTLVNSDGSESVATVKYDSAGNQLWVQTVSAQQGYVAVDGNDNVTVLTQSNQVDPNSGDEVVTTLLFHYNSAGKLTSSADLSYAFDAYRGPEQKIFASPNGDTTVFGTDADGDGGDDGTSVFVARFTSTGSFVYYKQYEGSFSEGDNFPDEAALDPHGNLILTGHEDDNDGDNDKINLFVNKYSPTGSLLYNTVYQDALEPDGASYPTALILDPAGTAYIAGQLSDESSTEMLFLRVKPDGGIKWARHYSVEAVGDDYPYAHPDAITLDHSGNVVIAGEDSLNGGETALLKYNTSGHRLYLTHPSQLHTNGIKSLFASSRTDDVYVVDKSGAYLSNGDVVNNITVAKIDPSGNAQNEDVYTGSTEDPGNFLFEGATFDPLLDTVYTITSTDFTPGTSTSDKSADLDWVTAKFRLGG